MALYHATSNGAALVYLSSVALQPLLKLCERTTQFKSLQQRRVISLLTERISLVPPEGEEDEYCFDRQRSTTKRVVEMVNEDVVPMEVEEIQSDSEKWRQCIVFWCFQKDVVVCYESNLHCSNEKQVFERFVITFNEVTNKQR